MGFLFRGDETRRGQRSAEQRPPTERGPRNGKNFSAGPGEGSRAEMNRETNPFLSPLSDIELDLDLDLDLDVM